MEIVIPTAAVLIGTIVLTMSMRVLTTALPRRRIPYWTNAAGTPARAIVLRVVGVFFAFMGGAALGPTIGYWTGVVIVATFIPGTVLLVVHNRQVAQTRA